VYGASDATAGELIVDGSFTGSAYGTSAGVVGCTQPAGAAPLLAMSPLAVAAPALLTPAEAVPAVRNETTAAVATATTDSLPGDMGTFVLLFSRLLFSR
jgi:hypothetical protein